MIGGWWTYLIRLAIKSNECTNDLSSSGFACLSLLGGKGGCSARSPGNRVDNFSGTRISQLLAGFLFDCSGIVLQRINMVRELLVFLFEFLDLFRKRAMLFALVGVDHRPIRSENYVVGHPHCEQA